MANWLPAIFIGAFVVVCIVGFGPAVRELATRNFWKLLPAQRTRPISSEPGEPHSPPEGVVYADDPDFEQAIAEAMQNRPGSTSRLNAPHIAFLAASGIAFVIAVVLAGKTVWPPVETPEEEFADSLTRSACWSSRSITNDFRLTMCFFNPPRVTMTNYTITADNQKWTVCDWSGDYSRDGNSLAVTFEENSGKCSNGVPSPRQTSACGYSGHSVECHSSRIVSGQKYEFDIVLR